MLVKYFELRGILIPTKVLGRCMAARRQETKLVHFMFTIYCEDSKKSTLRKEKVGVNKCGNSLRVKFSMDVSEQ